MTPLTVDLGPRSYPIHFTGDLPGPLAASSARAAFPEAGVAAIVTDTNVAPRYASEVAQSFLDAGFAAAPVLVLSAGEASKTLATVGRVVDFALDSAGMTRQDCFVALGGGVVGDITGFAASTLHRGVGFVQVPTTLLAQVDSAVGGKTGVNHRAGKNLLGAFWQPAAVVSSQRVLRTLPPREVRCGLAEGIKHALLADAALAERVEAEAAALRALEPGPVAGLVRACCAIKARVVGEDERDTGERAILNFGHTFGHAYERLAGYGALTHGEAVALGMVLAARLSERLGVAAEGLEARISGVLTALGLPADPDAPGRPDIPALATAARTDKKATHAGVRFVLLEAIGRPLIRSTTWSEITASLDDAAAHEEVES